MPRLSLHTPSKGYSRETTVDKTGDRLIISPFPNPVKQLDDYLKCLYINFN